jgi:predicted TIM-barrel fold metal-dependent hydrolase
VKLGGLGMGYLGFGFNKLERPAGSAVLAQAWGPFFEYCIEQFGPERCMFESNFPPDRESVDYHVVWNAFKRIAAPYTEAQKHQLFFATAAQVYRLDV